MQKNGSKYPSTFYRVTVKGIVRDEEGKVLVVKEGSDNWSLPGGGIDHGETLEIALAREMYEEALITQPFTAAIVGTDTFVAQSNDVYFMWVVCELQFSADIQFGVGKDARAVQFINPRSFKNSQHRSERLAYKWCVDKNAKF